MRVQRWEHQIELRRLRKAHQAELKQQRAEHREQLQAQERAHAAQVRRLQRAQERMPRRATQTQAPDAACAAAVEAADRAVHTEILRPRGQRSAIALADALEQRATGWRRVAEAQGARGLLGRAAQLAAEGDQGRADAIRRRVQGAVR